MEAENVAEIGPDRPEFQAVIVVEYDDGRMFPLTDDLPKCLLPIANRRLLSYQLDMLTKSSVQELFIVAPRDYESALKQFLAEHVRSGDMNIDLVITDDMIGSADGLRAVSDRIRGDFICLSADFISSVALGELTHLHRVNSSDCTMLLVRAGAESKRDEVDQEYVGMADDGRVLMKVPLLEIEEELEIPKELLHKTSSFNLRDDVVDLGVYVFSYWVMEYLKDNERVSNVRGELVPFLINRQYQTPAYLRKTMPALKYRARPLNKLEPWLVSNATNASDSKSALPPLWDLDHACASSSLGELCDTLVNGGHLNAETSTKAMSSVTGADTPVPMGGSASDVSVCGVDTSLNGAGCAGEGSSSEAVKGQGSDMLRCYCLMYEEPMGSTGGTLLLSRITNIQTYLGLNKDIPLHAYTKNTPWSRLTGYLKKELSVVGEGCDYNVEGKMVTIKQCSIGNNCSIGNKTKLNNCVVMDNVTIGDMCVIQNCVLSSGVVIESNCNMNECTIGTGYRVPSGTKAKVDSFSARD